MNEWTPPVIVGAGDETQPPATSHNVKAQDEHWILEHSDDVLTLIRPDGVKHCVDFTAGKTRHRSRESGHGAGVLSKALGITAFRKRHARDPAIIDGTGGWGQDAWAIASTGCAVTILERHAVVHALLADGLSRAVSEKDSVAIAERITLIHSDALSVFASTESGLSPDAIYLDPMYPARARKKADSKKGMQFLQALLGPCDELDSGRLLAAALNSSPGRVVVKRPKGAQPLPPPDGWSGQKTMISSPNTRYDIYLKR